MVNYQLSNSLPGVAATTAGIFYLLKPFVIEGGVFYANHESQSGNPI